ncbi:hypothetical protein [Azospirillum canadense]|uniref:hypothetical protein n=1 Tax=Azospirillum canadense TaxID=403962 RepID=UPI002227FB8E|nr:hypothetical protein [Azospirillum canadense]MCW2243142.1 hypothetical protein [Azospirillum canadense]
MTQTVAQLSYATTSASLPQRNALPSTHMRRKTVIMHRMLITGETFRWADKDAAA